MCDYAGNAGFITGHDAGNYGDGLIDGVVVQGFVVIQPGENHRRDVQHDARGREADEHQLLHDACGPDDNDGYVGGFQDDVVRWGAFAPQPDWQGPFATFATLIPATTSSAPRIPEWCNPFFAMARCKGSITASIPRSLPMPQAGTTACLSTLTTCKKTCLRRKNYEADYPSRFR